MVNPPWGIHREDLLIFWDAAKPSFIYIHIYIYVHIYIYMYIYTHLEFILSSAALATIDFFNGFGRHRCDTVLLRSDGQAVDTAFLRFVMAVQHSSWARGEIRDGRCNIPFFSWGFDIHTGFCRLSSHRTGIRSDGSADACGWNDFGQCNIPPLDDGIRYTQVCALWIGWGHWLV